MKKFPDLNKYRTRAGLSQTDLATLAKTSRDTVSKVENDDACRDDIAYRLVNALNEAFYKSEGQPIDPDEALVSSPVKQPR